jgi:hypothetical protein
MGYNFHITRAANFWESEETPIDKEEWEQLAGNTSDLVFEGHVGWSDIGPQRVYALSGESANFSWRGGRVVIEGYYSDRAERIANQLATSLGGRVQGDDED